MAHLLLHLTSVRLLEADENLHPLGREALKRRRGLVQLGCVLLDLPNFHGGYGAALKALVGQELPPSPWAARLHHEKPMALGLRLLQPRDVDHAMGPLGRLALAIGYFSHAALDASLHPLVHAVAASEAARGSGDVVQCHRQVERHQAAFIHPRLTGMELDDDHHLWAACDLLASPDLERSLDHVEACLRAERGEAPAALEWRGWLDGLRRYGRLGRGRIVRADGGRASDLQGLRSRCYEAPRFEEAVLNAQARALVWVNRLCAAFAMGDVDQVALETLAEQFPEVDLDAEKPLDGATLGAELAVQRALTQQWKAHAAALNARDNTAMGNRAAPPLPAFSEPPLSVNESDFEAEEVTSDAVAEVPPTPPPEPVGAPIGEHFTDMAMPPATDPEPLIAEEAPDDNPLRPKGRAPR